MIGIDSDPGWSVPNRRENAEARVEGECAVVSRMAGR